MKDRSKGRLAPGENFVMHTLSMRTSPAWAVLSDVAHRVLDRLEVEHLQHGACENGNLICTYADFEKAGIRRQSVNKALFALEALGFIEIIERGRRAATGFNVTSRYRLTYLSNNLRRNVRDPNPPTNDWARIKDEEQATAALERAESVRMSKARTTRKVAGKKAA